jgi:hypothetical protein
MKLGLKHMNVNKLGQKLIHTTGKFGLKASETARRIAPVAGLALGPEVGGALEVGGIIGGELSKGLEKISK